jgi:GNAT superfamily N-acetyltransferase
MENELEIRFADTEDINTIGYLAQQIWPVTYGDILSAPQMDYMLNLFYNPASLREQMQEKKHRFLIAEIEEQPVGFASYSATEDAGVFKLHKLYVDTSIQGKGIGKALINFVLEEMKELRGRTLILNVNRHNRAKNFYERLGFAVTGEADVNIGQGYFMNDYIMEKKIDGQ